MTERRSYRFDPASGNGNGDRDGDGLRGRVRIFLRPIGAPTPIGFFGLAAATLVLSGLQLGWVAPAEAKNVALVLIGFAFPAQLLAAIFAFLGRDGVAATAMGVLALCWLVVGLVLGTSAPGAVSGVLGLFLLVIGLAMTLTGVSAAASKLIPACVFLMAAARFLVSGGYELTGGRVWEDTAGGIGLVLFAFAVYAAWAAELEDAVGRTLLPLGRWAKGRSALRGGLPEQVEDAATEPGVRTQL